MNVIVIGGAGFIGSHLVDRLLAEDHSVDVIDDLSVGSLANLAEARASGGALKIHHLDAVSAEADTLLGMRRPDVVYHLGLLPRHDRSARAQGRAFTSALATMEAARRHGVAKVVVALPAGAIYGQPSARSLPVKESDLVPRGVRGVVARAIVDLLTTYRERHAVEFTALAMTTVYGPRQRPDSGVVAAFEEAAAASVPAVIDGDGRQTRDLLFIDDAVDALVRSSDHGGGLVINVGTGEQTSIRDLWDRVSERLGGRGIVEPQTRPARPDEMARFAVSPVRARIHLSWSPWTDLDSGLSRLHR
jgi:UDP-glucose 4-epimerase